MPEKPDLDKKQLIQQVEEDIGEKLENWKYYVKCEACGQWIKMKETVDKGHQTPRGEPPYEEEWIGFRLVQEKNGTYTWKDEIEIDHAEDFMKLFCSEKCHTAEEL